jgi:hypothetical protein
LYCSNGIPSTPPEMENDHIKIVALLSVYSAMLLSLF